MKKIISFLLIGFFVTSCAHYDPKKEEQAYGDFDPIEKANRVMFKINDAFDSLILKPTAKGYRDHTVNPFKYYVGNLVNNFRLPTTIMNNFFQGDIRESNDNFARFFVNSTLGLGGLLNFFGDEPKHTGFGDTLAHMGVGEGLYIVLPFYGPSTARDSWGFVVDTVTNPFTYLGYVSIVKSVTTAVHDRAETIDILDEVRENSLDYYIKLRSLYLQKRYDETHAKN